MIKGYLILLSHQKRRNSPAPIVVPLTVAVLLLHLTVQCCTAAGSIDLTTEYTIARKTSSVTTRSSKTKILPSSLSSSAASLSSSTSVTAGTASDSAISASSLAKSYVTPPATQIPKLHKRAGLLADLKSKKIFKDAKGNRSRETTPRHSIPNEAEDYIPDSSGQIPVTAFRSEGRLPQIPAKPVGDYPADGPSVAASSISSGQYNSGPYEGEKWRPDFWDRDYTKRFQYNNTRVQHIEAECQDDFMKIRIGFNGSFSGLLYSAGYAYDPDCMYINGSGRDFYEFYIQLNRCGTLGKNALHDESRKNPTNFMWNTVTVQYNPLIEEEFDEHFKVTCEYGYDFWKTVTFPFLDVEVATGNPVVFTLSPPECYMEIQNGYGIGGPRVTGPVRVGDPLTLIIYMRSKYDGFDIVVNDCYAHNGANKRIQLIDDYGCPVDDKLISRFRGSWSDSGVYETQIYAYMKTFRFTGSPALYIECDVRMCHGRCPSQPCHWRNLKAVTKRDISNSSSTSASSDSHGLKTDPPLSENVNLFQSLRVLQEGENDGDHIYTNRRSPETNAHQTCLKTTTFSAMTAAFSVALCVLAASLLIACARLRHRSKESTLYETYITHKGQID